VLIVPPPPSLSLSLTQSSFEVINSALREAAENQTPLEFCRALQNQWSALETKPERSPYQDAADHAIAAKTTIRGIFADEWRKTPRWQRRVFKVIAAFSLPAIAGYIGISSLSGSTPPSSSGVPVVTNTPALKPPIPPKPSPFSNGPTVVEKPSLSNPYHQPVIRHGDLVPIFLFPDDQAQENLMQFTQDFLDSNEFKMLRQYGVKSARLRPAVNLSSDPSSMKFLEDIQYIESVNRRDTPEEANLAQNAISAAISGYVDHLVASGIVPKGAQPLLFFPPEMMLSPNGYEFFYGYHGVASSGVPFSVVEYNTSQYLVTGHEIPEMLTDPYLYGWRDRIKSTKKVINGDYGEEVGDLCQDQRTSIGEYPTQKLWNNEAGRCTGNTSPAPKWLPHLFAKPDIIKAVGDSDAVAQARSAVKDAWDRYANRADPDDIKPAERDAPENGPAQAAFRNLNRGRDGRS